MTQPTRWAILGTGTVACPAPLLKGMVSGETGSIRAPFLGNGYAHEAAHPMDCVAAGRRESDIMPLSRSVEILEVVDGALAQVGARA